MVYVNKKASRLRYDELVERKEKADKMPRDELAATTLGFIAIDAHCLLNDLLRIPRFQRNADDIALLKDTERLTISSYIDASVASNNTSTSYGHVYNAFSVVMESRFLAATFEDMEMLEKLSAEFIRMHRLGFAGSLIVTDPEKNSSLLSALTRPDPDTESTVKKAAAGAAAQEMRS